MDSMAILNPSNCEVTSALKVLNSSFKSPKIVSLITLINSSLNDKKSI